MKALESRLPLTVMAGVPSAAAVVGFHACASRAILVPALMVSLLQMLLLSSSHN